MSLLTLAIAAPEHTFLRMAMQQDLGRRGAGKPGRPKPALAALAWALGVMTAVPALAQKDPPPDVMERLREAQKALDGLSPEQKKQLRDMGIALPDGSAIPRVTQSELANAAQGPKPAGKDTARIARIGTTPLTATTLPAFVRDAQAHLAPRLQPQAAALGEALYRDLRAQGKTAAEMGQAAAGLWVVGRVHTALALMAKVSQDAPADTDNLNNFAAMLSMSGTEQLAIPLLNYLNQQFPNNSTVLNNLGQAWYGLGDTDKAAPLLTAAVRRYANHPQANVTLSYIEEAAGNKAAAVASMKRAVKYSYSLDKRNRLRKLGYSLQGDDVTLPLDWKPESDPMGLNGFEPPRIPTSAEEEVATAAEWRAFRSGVDSKLEALTRQRHALTAAAQQNMVQQGGNAAAGRPVAVMSDDKPPYHDRAVLKLKAMERDGGVRFRHDSARKALDSYAKALRETRETYYRERNQLDRRAALQTGEGQKNADLCTERQAVITKALKAYNVGYQERVNVYLQATRLKLNEELFWQQFKDTPERFRVTQIDQQMAWLSALSKAGHHLSTDDATACAPPPTAKTGGQLADFYTLNCPYRSELSFGSLGSIRSDCNKTTTTLGVGFLKLGLTQDMDRNTFADQFVSCNVEVSAGVSRSVQAGPVEVGVQAGGSLGIEIGRTGIQDVYVTGGVGASVGALGAPAVEMGAAARISLVSGAAIGGGTGLFGN